MITHVDEKGFLYFAADRRLGRADPRRPAGRGRDPRRAGARSRRPQGRSTCSRTSRRSRRSSSTGLHIDIGAADRERALELVRIGDPVVIDAEPRALDGGRLVSRSMDDRLGAYVALESLRRCHERGQLTGRMAAIASVQEEIGLNGAATSAFAVAPDLALAIDVTHATDAPGMEEKELGQPRARLRAGDRPRLDAGAASLRAALRGRRAASGSSTRSRPRAGATGTDADAIQISQGRASRPAWSASRCATCTPRSSWSTSATSRRWSSWSCGFAESLDADARPLALVPDPQSLSAFSVYVATSSPWSRTWPSIASRTSSSLNSPSSPRLGTSSA